MSDVSSNSANVSSLLFGGRVHVSPPFSNSLHSQCYPGDKGTSTSQKEYREVPDVEEGIPPSWSMLQIPSPDSYSGGES